LPEVSRFFGIVIKIFFDDHQPAHFHAQYGEYEAKVGIESLSLLDGTLPSRALGLVIEWASLHQKELSECWKSAEDLKPLGKIAPLE
jgi:hypothetical protein